MIKTKFLFFFSFLVASVAFAEEMPATTEQANTQTSTEQTVSDTANDNSSGNIQRTATTESETLTEQSGFSRGSVMRSVFTNGIENREPVDNMQAVGNAANNITYFTELRDMSGQMAKHRWEHNGNVMAEVEFNVRGPRWRVWSSKALMPQWEGEWKVSVLNAAGEVISEELINYKNVDEAAAESAIDSENRPDMMESSPSPSPQQPANTQ